MENDKICPNCNIKMLFMASVPCNLDDVDITRPCDIDVEEIMQKVKVSWHCKQCYYQEKGDK